VVLVLVLGSVGIGGLSGYRSGVLRAESSDAQTAAQSAQEQFDLGVQDLLGGRYELARQRFDYILGIDPLYPGAAELRDRALQGLNVPTPSPTLPVPTATPRPTLDMSSLEGIWQQAQAAFAAGDNPGTLQALLALRQLDPAFRLAEINGLMAISLRNQGLDLILGGEQEQGIYSLALAERFGPLDAQAANWRGTAEFYLWANSWFGLDWPQAVSLFSQACSAGVWDSCYKYAVSLKEYGNLLMLTPDPCAASEQYQRSLDMRPDDGLRPTATYAAAQCLTATFVPPTGSPTLTPTATETGIILPTDTPTPEFTPTPTIESPTPTETPTETPTP
jgi:tetratricopeptide (TPR) repeat protein